MRRRCFWLKRRGLLFELFFAAARIAVSAMPLAMTVYATAIYAQDQDRFERQLERRTSAAEVMLARHDEKFIAILAQVQTLSSSHEALRDLVWWLAAATLGSGTVSGAVAADRAVFRLRNRRNSE